MAETNGSASAEPHHPAPDTTTNGSASNGDATSDVTTDSGENPGNHAEAAGGQELGSPMSKKAEKERLKQEKKEQKIMEKARKKDEKDSKKGLGRLHMDGMVDKAIRMLYPITREGRKSLNAAIKDQIIPTSLIRNAKGLAFFTIAKTGLVLGVQGGLGILIGRKPDGGWSPPCAFQTGGMSCGVLIGVSVVDLLLIINTEEQLKIMSSKGMVKLGGDLEVTVGPLGRNAQAAVAAGNKGVAGCYAYSFSKGIYGGISLDGGMIWPYSGENHRFYGRDVRVQDLFAGHVEVEDPRRRELLDRFNEILAVVSERATRRSRTAGASSTGDTQSAISTDEADTPELPEAVLNYLKERPGDNN